MSCMTALTLAAFDALVHGNDMIDDDNIVDNNNNDNASNS